MLNCAGWTLLLTDLPQLTKMALEEGGVVAMRKRWLVFVTILTIILALSSCSKPPAPLPPSPTPPEVKEGLAILSHSSYIDDFGYFHLVGEVENVGSQNTELNKVAVTFFDSSGTPVVTASNYSYLDILIPGQKSPFEITLSTAPPVVNYKLESTWQVTTREPYMDLNIQGITLEREEQDWGYLSGQIRNTGSEMVDVTIIVGTFYNGDGKVVGATLTFSDILPLGPRESSPFATIVNPQVVRAMQTYLLQAQGVRRP